MWVNQGAAVGKLVAPKIFPFWSFLAPDLAMTRLLQSLRRVLGWTPPKSAPRARTIDTDFSIFRGASSDLRAELITDITQRAIGPCCIPSSLP